jgi:hypothetical protein
MECGKHYEYVEEKAKLLITTVALFAIYVKSGTLEEGRAANKSPH